MKTRIQVIVMLSALVLSGAAALAQGTDAGNNAAVVVRSAQTECQAGAGQCTSPSNGGSARSTAGTQAVVEYDFTTGSGKYYGTDGFKDLGGGVYGMIAGDTDGSGTVDANDRSAAWNDRNKTGYEPADCDLSGTVDANDRSITWNNRNQTTSVP